MNTETNTNYSNIKELCDKIETREDFEYRITKYFNQFINQDIKENIMEYRYHHRFLIRDVEEAYANISKINKMKYIDILNDSNSNSNDNYEKCLKQLQTTENILYKFELEYKNLLEPKSLYFTYFT